METPEARGWLVAVIAAIGGAFSIVAAILQFGTGLTLTNPVTGDVLNPQPAIALRGLDDWVALGAGVLMLVGAVVFLVLRSRNQGLVAAGLVGAGAVLALVFAIKVALDVGGSGEVPLGLRFETETGETFTGTLEENIAIGVWLLIAGAVAGLVAAVLMFRGSRRRGLVAAPTPA
jgi:hypothetical protein